MKQTTRFILLMLLLIPVLSISSSALSPYSASSEDNSLFGKLFSLQPLLVIYAILSIFWFWMLIDCLRREFKDKAWWVVIMLVLGEAGAIVYFLLVRRNPKHPDGQLKKDFSFWVGLFILVGIIYLPLWLLL